MRLFHILLLTLQSIYIYGGGEFTNLKCNSLNKTFAKFEYCYLKAINRTYKYVSLRSKIYQLPAKPIKNVKLIVAVLKKTNGYKPFLSNISIDACRYLKYRNNIVLRYLHSTCEKYGNYDHECPFNHDVYVEKCPYAQIESVLVNQLHIPRGDYLMQVSVAIDRVERAIIQAFWRFT